MKITNILAKDGSYQIFKGGQITISYPTNSNGARVNLSNGQELEELLILNPMFNFLNDSIDPKTIQIHGFVYDQCQGNFHSVRIWCRYD